MGPRGSHSIRLPGAGLTIGQDGDIVALKKRLYTFAQVLPYSALVYGLGKHAIENEQLAALGNVDGQIAERGDMNHGPLEALRNQFIARIRRS